MIWQNLGLWTLGEFCHEAVEVHLEAALVHPQQAEHGAAVVEVCRKMDISEQTFYRGHKQYSGTKPEELRRLKQLEEEIRKLKRLVADLSLDKAMLRMDQLSSGRRVRGRSIRWAAPADLDGDRQLHAGEPGHRVDQGICVQRVAEMLDGIAEARSSLPERVFLDNGPEFASKALDPWAYEHGVTLDFARPGKPKANAMTESFSGRLRYARLSANWFLSL